jgi:hypothetical protein
VPAAPDDVGELDVAVRSDGPDAGVAIVGELDMFTGSQLDKALTRIYDPVALARSTLPILPENCSCRTDAPQRGV